jgi:hypothetical protein
MKKILILTILVISLSFIIDVQFPSKAEANSGFILGVNFGTTNTDHNTNDYLRANIIYIIPELGQKINENNFLEIRSITVCGKDYIANVININFTNKTIKQIFHKALKKIKIKNPDQYKILQIIRTQPSPVNHEMLYTFFYIDKEKLN